MSQPTPTTDDAILDFIFSPGSEFSFGQDSPGVPLLKAPVIDEETLTRIRKMEREAVQLADSNESLMEALDILQQVLTICPQYASALNNRAQVYRILGRSQEAMEDLNKAIELAYDYDVLGKAYTQRAVLKATLGDNEGSAKDFQMGSKLGNQIAAKKVSENPYAKLCNAMVAEAMKRELKHM